MIEYNNYQSTSMYVYIQYIYSIYDVLKIYFVKYISPRSKTKDDGDCTK